MNFDLAQGYALNALAGNVAFFFLDVIVHSVIDRILKTLQLDDILFDGMYSMLSKSLPIKELYLAYAHNLLY